MMISGLVIEFQYLFLLIDVLDEFLIRGHGDLLLVELGNQKVLQDFKNLLVELQVLVPEDQSQLVVLVLQAFVGHLLRPDLVLQEAFLLLQILYLVISLLYFLLLRLKSVLHLGILLIHLLPVHIVALLL